MVDPILKRQGIALAFEMLSPLALALGAMVAIYVYAPEIASNFAPSGTWQAASLYGAVFNWSAIQTGFAFGVYGFVMGKSSGFIAEIRDERPTKRFMGYVKRANIGGFLLTILSLPLTIVNPPVTGQGVSFFLVVAWFGLFVWTFAAFLRIAYGFGHLSSVRDQPEFYGAGK